MTVWHWAGGNVSTLSGRAVAVARQEIHIKLKLSIIELMQRALLRKRMCMNVRSYYNNEILFIKLNNFTMEFK